MRHHKRPYQTKIPIMGKAKVRLGRRISLLLLLGLGCFLMAGCFGFSPIGSHQEPSNPTPPVNQPPVTREDPPVGKPGPDGLSVQWRQLSTLSSEEWTSKENGPGTPLFCRIGEDRLHLWCFDRYTQSFVSLFQAQGQTIVSLATSHSDQRIALLLKDESGGMTLSASRAPFLSFQVERTFPAGSGGTSLTHVGFMGETLVVYAKGMMYSEISGFREPLSGAGQLPAIGKLHYLNAGYYLARDTETGELMQNRSSQVTAWEVIPPPDQNSKARALQLSTNGDRLAVMYNDGAVYWRCSEGAGFQSYPLKRAPKAIFWMPTDDGAQLVAVNETGLLFVALQESRQLVLPANTNTLLEAASLSPGRLFALSPDAWWEGIVVPTKQALTCP